MRFFFVLVLRAYCMKDSDALYPPGLTLWPAQLLNIIVISLNAIVLHPASRQWYARCLGLSEVHLRAIPARAASAAQPGWLQPGARTKASVASDEREEDLAASDDELARMRSEGDVRSETSRASDRTHGGGGGSVLSFILAASASTEPRPQQPAADARSEGRRSPDARSASQDARGCQDAQPASAVAITWITSMPSFHGQPFRPSADLGQHEASFKIEDKWLTLPVRKVMLAEQPQSPDSYFFYNEPRSQVQLNGSAHVATHMVISPSADRRIDTWLFFKRLSDGHITRLNIQACVKSSPGVAPAPP